VRTLLLGAFGALLPELLRLYRMRNSPLSFPKTYFLLSIAYFIASGILVLVLPGDKSPFTAIYLGASSDYLITGLSKRSISTVLNGTTLPAEATAETPPSGDVSVDDIIVKIEQPEGKRLLYEYLDLL
jgi:hypothetical protein